LIVARILNEIHKQKNTKIFALSFTNKAANELKDRIDDNIFSTNLWKERSNIFT
jgi:ATP-dependent exoDNAse (exonuclease V) beta subunit